MRYKSFIWPHNPRTYTIEYERQVAVHKIPFGRYAMQDLGLGRRVMRGEGEFYGPSAYEDFKKLATVFYDGGPGTLLHPVWQSAQVYFVELALAQEPRRDYVRYTFTFWEEYDKYRQELVPVGQESSGQSGGSTPVTPAPEGAVYHTVVAGDTLWALAQTYGVTMGEILVWNPQLKNPNVILPGQRLRVG
ncbi:MAG TPA: LysM peptidoglycan-binding domain-containing protein [Candidatus Evtepia faecigallinarum]|nr:LysM peptidoglycan-binding domain-containing protein [Candidatus Evtepia faecigallinarum]